MMTGSLAIAEDVVQDAYLAIYQRSGTIKDLDGYLYRTVVNRCRSHLRRTRLESKPASEPTRLSLGEPELDETWAAILRLPIRQRSVIVLRYYEDQTEAQVARILGCRLGTVKSAHHRALRALRETLS